MKGHRYSYFEIERAMLFRIVRACDDPDDGADTVADLPYYFPDEPGKGQQDATLTRDQQRCNAEEIVRRLNREC